MRLFTAIELTDSARRHLVDVQQSLRHAVREGLSWTTSDNLHLTLKFIGEVSDHRVDSLCDALREASAKSMQLRTGGLVLFPPRGPVRIIACGFAGDAGNVLMLQDHIESLCERQGIARETRHYVPHVTLARARRPLGASKREEVSRIGIPDGPQFDCRQFVLMQSHLESSGARYAVVARFGQA